MLEQARFWAFDAQTCVRDRTWQHGLDGPGAEPFAAVLKNRADAWGVANIRSITTLALLRGHFDVLHALVDGGIDVAARCSPWLLGLMGEPEEWWSAFWPQFQWLVAHAQPHALTPGNNLQILLNAIVFEAVAALGATRALAAVGLARGAGLVAVARTVAGR